MAIPDNVHGIERRENFIMNYYQTQTIFPTSWEQQQVSKKDERSIDLKMLVVIYWEMFYFFSVNGRNFELNYPWIGYWMPIEGSLECFQLNIFHH